MELDHYIQSGIIESYVLGLATPVEVEELQYMSRLYPEINREIAMVERRMERTAFAEAVMPPSQLKDKILQRINWSEENYRTEERDRANANGNPNYTFINMQPQGQQFITVHKWWKFFFIAVFILSKFLLATAIYFFLKYEQLKDARAVEASSHTEQHISSSK